jgi:hypothetical protein
MHIAHANGNPPLNGVGVLRALSGTSFANFALRDLNAKDAKAAQSARTDRLALFTDCKLLYLSFFQSVDYRP